MIVYEFLKEVLEGLNMTYRSNEKRWQALIGKAMSMEVRRANLQDFSLAAVRPGNQRTTSAYSGKKKKRRELKERWPLFKNCTIRFY